MDTEFVGDHSYRVPISSTFYFEDAFDPSIKAEKRVRSLSRIDRSEVSGWVLSRRRRFIDVGVATFALAASLPLMGITALAVKLSSPGPVLFKQKRMGRNGLVFTLYKFRSMRVAAGTSSPITVTGDNRITRIGSLLRKYKLDELPQFWNVLRGDMSLVGPRPKLPHHEGLHMPFRPGISGAATLAFRTEEEMLSQIPLEHLDAYYERFVKPLKARIDREYMQSASLKTDLGILWQTAKCCISKKESKYRVILPDFDNSAYKNQLPPTGTEPAPAFGIPVV